MRDLESKSFRLTQEINENLTSRVLRGKCLNILNKIISGKVSILFHIKLSSQIFFSNKYSRNITTESWTKFSRGPCQKKLYACYKRSSIKSNAKSLKVFTIGLFHYVKAAVWKKCLMYVYGMDMRNRAVFLKIKTKLFSLQNSSPAEYFEYIWERGDCGEFK